ncbi:hypothetical protein GCM10022227_16120 [Streptomyces sedi]
MLNLPPGRCVERGEGAPHGAAEANDEEGGTMADLAMDYDKLYAMQRGLHALVERADTAGGIGAWQEIGDGTATSNESIFGNYELSYEFQVFYGLSKTRIDEGKDKLERFGDMFGGVADAMLQQDATLASNALVMAGQTLHDRWLGEKEAVENWEDRNDAWNSYLEEIGASDYFDEHPDADIWEVCSNPEAPEWCQAWKDDYGEDRPAPPGERPPDPEDDQPTHIWLEDEDGSSVKVWLEFDDDHNVIGEKTTVDTGNGQETTTTIEYDGAPDPSEPDDDGNTYDRRDYTITTINPDGSETVSEVTINEDGSGSQTSTTTSTNDDGEEETEVTEYTRKGPSGDDAEWVEVDEDD